jgi:hypothetical protein
MRFAFLFLPLALGLSACAQENTIAGTNACERSAPPDREAVWRMVEPGVISAGGPVSSGKYLLGGATNTAKCVHQEDNEGNAPQTRDLQKIG